MNEHSTRQSMLPELSADELAALIAELSSSESPDDDFLGALLDEYDRRPESELPGLDVQRAACKRRMGLAPERQNILRFALPAAAAIALLLGGSLLLPRLNAREAAADPPAVLEVSPSPAAEETPVPETPRVDRAASVTPAPTPEVTAEETPSPSPEAEPEEAEAAPVAVSAPRTTSPPSASNAGAPAPPEVRNDPLEESLDNFVLPDNEPADVPPADNSVVFPTSGGAASPNDSPSGTGETDDTQAGSAADSGDMLSSDEPDAAVPDETEPEAPPLSGWVQVGGVWYFLRDDGSMATGWVQVGGAWYYFHDDGSMAADETIDGWTLDASGVWIE